MEADMAPEALKNEKAFDRRIARGVCLICFYTPWSAPCRLQVAILDRLVRYYDNRVIMLDLNVDYMEKLRMRFGVYRIPTLIVFKNGVECHRLVGVQPESDLCRIIDSELAAAASGRNHTDKVKST
ncbi:MAG: thioredoxin family protein [Desulfosalsimonas sp.]